MIYFLIFVMQAWFEDFHSWPFGDEQCAFNKIFRSSGYKQISKKLTKTKRNGWTACSIDECRWASKLAVLFKSSRILFFYKRHFQYPFLRLIAGTCKPSREHSLGNCSLLGKITSTLVVFQAEKIEPSTQVKEKQQSDSPDYVNFPGKRVYLATKRRPPKKNRNEQRHGAPRLVKVCDAFLFFFSDNDEENIYHFCLVL